MPAPRIHGIVETCISASDLTRSTQFYQDVLGLRLIEHLEHRSAFAAGDHQVFLIFQRGAMLKPVLMPGGLIPAHDSSGQAHFAFSISKDDFLAWEKQLTAKGVAIESEVDWPAGGKSIYFRDPDDNLVEVATPGIWEVY